MKPTRIRMLWSAGIFLALCFAVAAQEAKTASIVLEVKDQTGAAIPNARVQIVPLPKNAVEQLVNDSEGKLSLEVSPGSYDLTVESPGFVTVTKHVEARPDTHQTIEVVLTVWSCASCPMVTSEFPVSFPEQSQATLFATSLLAQKETFAPANDVSFTVSAERRSYKVGEQITLNYRIANISNAPLYVPREWEVKCPASPHLWAGFENSSGEHFIPGYGGDCWTKINSLTITERMSKEAVLLTPGEHLDGTFRLDTKLFGGLKPGAYRIEAALSGWAEEKFTDAEKSELARMPYPFLRGEIPNSVRITLTSNEK